MGCKMKENKKDINTIDDFIGQFNKILDEQMEVNKKLNKIQKATTLLKSMYKEANANEKVKIESAMKEIESKLKILYSKSLEINKKTKQLSNDQSLKQKKGN